MKFKSWGMVATLVLALPNVAWAWQQECEPTFDSFAQVQAQANKGNAEAQYWLGEAYFDGENGFEAPLEVDYVQARAWYDKAAAQKDACAQHAIGWMYDSGEGVDEDMTQAFAWYEKAAQQGLSKSQFNLGVLYRDGVGVEQDMGAAKTWFGKAAAQGDEEAAAELADWPQE